MELDLELRVAIADVMVFDLVMDFDLVRGTGDADRMGGCIPPLPKDDRESLRICILRSCMSSSR